jgi:hypothetical protein
MTRRFRRTMAVTALLALAPAFAGCGGSTNGYATPEACFAAMQTAVKNKDIAAVCDCMTDDSQTALTGILIVAGGMLKATTADRSQTDEARNAAAAISEVMAKHGATDAALTRLAPPPGTEGDPDSLRQLAGVVLDRKAFITDVYAAMEQSGLDARFSDQLQEQVSGQLNDVKIDGDRANAIVETAAGNVPIQFRRVGGSGWKLHVIDLEEMAAQREAAPQAAEPG